MFKYFLISVIFHSVIFGGFVFFKSKESNSSNYKEEVQVLQNKNNQYNLPDLEINQEKESIMNAVSITEEELEKEILRLKKQEKDEAFEKQQKYELLEKSIEIKQREIARQEKLQKEIIEREKQKIEEEKKELSTFQEEIKNNKNLLSQKEKELDKALKEISIKKKEFENLIEDNASKSEKKIKEKEIRIQQQQDTINQMNDKINQLQHELENQFGKYKEQMVITNKKEKKNDFLNKKSKEELEQLKKELYEYNLMIKERVLSNWEYKADIGGVSCYINIYQSTTGDILRVTTENCMASEDFIDSIKKATWKASPLPLPKKDSLFSKSINLYFTIK